jgi:hypothetical protein
MMSATNRIRRIFGSTKHMERPMRRLSAAVLVGMCALGTAACDSFLDVNTNPNAPQEVTPNLYLAPMIHWLVTAEQFDGRFIGRYTQAWMLPNATANTLPSVWDRHGYDRTSDNAAQIYREVYWTFGQNLIDMMNKSRAEERWDVLGVGYTLKAWGWYAATSIHGDIIIRDAFTPDQYYFAFDTQEYAYQEVLQLLDSALVNLQRTDGRVNPAYLAIGDKLFNGDRASWIKYVQGLRAVVLNHFSNKASYRPADVIAAVDQSFRSVAEEALFAYPNTSTDNVDRNFWGQTRSNLGSYRQTEFIVELMNGTQYPEAVDPRMTRMLSVAPDGAYRGLNVNTGYGAVVAERPNNLWGYVGTGSPGPTNPAKYLFDDRSRFPVRTYAQLQFIKAEAALRMGNQALAREAYLNGVAAHIDFVNARNAEIGNPAITQISAAEKAAFLTHPSIAPPTITLSHIMGQKFIAQWGWAWIESWMDLRRFGYTGMDPVSGTQVFRGWTVPLNLDVDNGGKTVQRIRPRYNSDYVWNRGELDKIGALAPDYHTKPMWITER